jgi:hypothetical protein
VLDNLLMGAYTREDKAGVEEDLEKVYNLEGPSAELADNEDVKKAYIGA